MKKIMNNIYIYIYIYALIPINIFYALKCELLLKLHLFLLTLNPFLY
jgi:hypothetical protein